MSSRHVERWTGAGSPPNGEAELTAFLRGGSTALQTSFLLFFVAFVVWLSWITAALVLVSIPAIYGGDHLSGIYSADGLVAEVLAFVPLYVWSLAVSIAIFRKPVTG